MMDTYSMSQLTSNAPCHILAAYSFFFMFTLKVIIHTFIIQFIFNDPFKRLKSLFKDFFVCRYKKPLCLLVMSLFQYLMCLLLFVAGFFLSYNVLHALVNFHFLVQNIFN